MCLVDYIIHLGHCLRWLLLRYSPPSLSFPVPWGGLSLVWRKSFSFHVSLRGSIISFNSLPPRIRLLSNNTHISSEVVTMNPYEQVHVCAENSESHLASSDCKEPPIIRHTVISSRCWSVKRNVHLWIGETQCPSKAYDYCTSCFVYIFWPRLTPPHILRDRDLMLQSVFAAAPLADNGGQACRQSSNPS